jgi:hypothetical protein
MNKKIKSNSFDDNFSSTINENNLNDEYLNLLSSKDHALGITQDVLSDKNNMEIIGTFKDQQENIAEKVEGVHYYTS